MPDPFSIIGLVVTTLKTITVAKNYVETVCRAPRCISALSADLADIETLLRQLGHVVSEKSGDELQMHKLLAGPIASCESVANELHKLIDPFIKMTGEVKTWSRLAFGFKESEVVLLSTKMGSCKQNLTLAVTSANLVASQKTVRGVARIQQHLGIETSSIASDDANGRAYERVEKWKSTTEVIIEEPNVRPPNPRPISTTSSLSLPPIISSRPKVETTQLHCAYCGKQFRNKLLFRLHSHSERRLSSTTPPPAYSATPTTPTEYPKPTAYEDDSEAENDLKCDSCGRHFHSSSSLRVHYYRGCTRHAPARPNLLAALTSSRSQRFENRITSRVDQMCLICKRQFDSDGDLAAHLRRGCGPDLMCLICKRSFDSKADVAAHQPCPGMYEQPPLPSALDTSRPAQSKTGPLRVRCSGCGAKCKNRENLRKHSLKCKA